MITDKCTNVAGINFPKESKHLRPWRIKNEVPMHFTCEEFKDGYGGCLITLRRMIVFGMIKKPHEGSLEGETFVDILDSEGDILETIEITKDGFEYLRKRLCARVEKIEESVS